MCNHESIAFAIITKISVLKHCWLSQDEERETRADINDLLTAADKAGLSYKLQNALLYIGEKYDVRTWYLSQLYEKALAHAGESARR